MIVKIPLNPNCMDVKAVTRILDEQVYILYCVMISWTYEQSVK